MSNGIFVKSDLSLGKIYKADILLDSIIQIQAEVELRNRHSKC